MRYEENDQLSIATSVQISTYCLFAVNFLLNNNHANREE